MGRHLHHSAGRSGGHIRACPDSLVPLHSDFDRLNLEGSVRSRGENGPL